MSFAALNIRSFCSDGYYEFRKCDKISLFIDITVLATAAIISSLILAGVIHMDLPASVGGFAQYFPWIIIGTSLAIGILDGVIATLKLKINSSPLHRTIENHNRETLLATLNNVDTIYESKDSKGRTALHLAARIGKVEAISDLIDAGLDIDAQDHRGMTPLILALSYQQEEAALQLLEANADVNVVSQGDKMHAKGDHRENCPGDTPLHIAATYGLADAAKKLLHQNANYEACNEYGATPLFNAVFLGKTEVVKQLLDAGADLNAVINCRGKYKGASLLHMAVAENYEEIVALLLQCPNIRNTRDINGNTPLDLAKYNPNIVNLLLKKFPNNEF